MVGDLDDHNISSVQNLRPLGSVEAYNFYNGLGRELGTFCVSSRVASQLIISGRTLSLLYYPTIHAECLNNQQRELFSLIMLQANVSSPHLIICTILYYKLLL